MELNTNIGPIFTQQQTVQPFTKQLRTFNLKEANSIGNCIGNGGCSYDAVAESYIQDTEKSLKKFLTQLKETIQPEIPGSLINRDIEAIEALETNNETGLLNSNVETFANTDVGTYLTNESSPFIANDDRYIDPTNEDITNNAELKDYTYNSYADWRAPTFNQWTKIHDDNCNEANRLRIGAKPMKYYINQYNSPQFEPFMQYSIVGNQKQYNVRNEFERPEPTRLNPIYPSQVTPYPTSPFLGQNYPDRMYVDTDDALRWSRDSAIRNKKTANDNSAKNYNRWDFVDAATVQNAGQFQFGAKLQSNGRFDLDKDGYYKYTGDNHVIMGNGAVPYFGLSSRNLLHNIVDLSGC